LILNVSPQQSKPATPACMDTVPDINKAKKETKIVSPSQLEPNAGLTDVSLEVSGYFELSAPPVADRYSHSSIITKNSFGTHFFASVHIAGLQGAATLEFQGRDVWFAIHTTEKIYFIYESEENWTHWRELKVERQPYINHLAIYQNGRDVSVFLNGRHVETFMKYREAASGPIGVGFKADPKTGGRIHFQKLCVWEF